MSLQLGISLSTTWVESRVLEFVLKDGWIYPQCGLHHVLLLLLMIPACSSFTKYTIYCNYCCYCLLIPYWHCVSMEYVSLHIYIYIYIDVYSIHNMSSILQFFPTSMGRLIKLFHVSAKTWGAARVGTWPGRIGGVGLVRAPEFASQGGCRWVRWVCCR